MMRRQGTAKASLFHSLFSGSAGGIGGTGSSTSPLQHYLSKSVQIIKSSTGSTYLTTYNYPGGRSQTFSHFYPLSASSGHRGGARPGGGAGQSYGYQGGGAASGSIYAGSYTGSTGHPALGVYNQPTTGIPTYPSTTPQTTSPVEQFMQSIGLMNPQSIYTPDWAQQWRGYRDFGFLTGLSQFYAYGMYETGVRAGYVGAPPGTSDMFTYQGRQDQAIQTAESYLLRPGSTPEQAGYNLGQANLWMARGAYWEQQQQQAPMSEAWNLAKIASYSMGQAGLIRAFGFPFYGALRQYATAAAMSPYIKGAQIADPSLMYKVIGPTGVGTDTTSPMFGTFQLPGLGQSLMGSLGEWTFAQSAFWGTRSGLEAAISAGPGVSKLGAFARGFRESLASSFGINVIQGGLGLMMEAYATRMAWDVAGLKVTPAMQSEYQLRMNIGAITTGLGGVIQAGSWAYGKVGGYTPENFYRLPSGGNLSPDVFSKLGPAPESFFDVTATTRFGTPLTSGRYGADPLFSQTQRLPYNYEPTFMQGKNAFGTQLDENVFNAMHVPAVKLTGLGKLANLGVGMAGFFAGQLIGGGTDVSGYDYSGKPYTVQVPGLGNLAYQALTGVPTSKQSPLVSTISGDITGFALQQVSMAAFQRFVIGRAIPLITAEAGVEATGIAATALGIAGPVGAIVGGAILANEVINLAVESQIMGNTGFRESLLAGNVELQKQYAALKVRDPAAYESYMKHLQWGGGMDQYNREIALAKDYQGLDMFAKTGKTSYLPRSILDKFIFPGGSTFTKPTTITTDTPISWGKPGYRGAPTQATYLKATTGNLLPNMLDAAAAGASYKITLPDGSVVTVGSFLDVPSTFGYTENAAVADAYKNQYAPGAKAYFGTGAGQDAYSRYQAGLISHGEFEYLRAGFWSGRMTYTLFQKDYEATDLFKVRKKIGTTSLYGTTATRSFIAYTLDPSGSEYHINPTTLQMFKGTYTANQATTTAYGGMRIGQPGPILNWGTVNDLGVMGGPVTAGWNPSMMWGAGAPPIAVGTYNKFGPNMESEIYPTFTDIMNPPELYKGAGPFTSSGKNIMWDVSTTGLPTGKGFTPTVAGMKAMANYTLANYFNNNMTPDQVTQNFTSAGYKEGVNFKWVDEVLQIMTKDGWQPAGRGGISTDVVFTAGKPTGWQGWDYTQRAAWITGHPGLTRTPTATGGTFDPVTGTWSGVTQWHLVNGKWVKGKAQAEDTSGIPGVPEGGYWWTKEADKRKAAKGFEGNIHGATQITVGESGPESVKITPYAYGSIPVGENLWKVIEEQDVGSSDISPIGMRINLAKGKNVSYGPEELSVIMPQIKRVTADTIAVMIDNGKLLSGNPNQWDYQTRTTATNALAPYIALKINDDSSR